MAGDSCWFQAAQPTGLPEVERDLSPAEIGSGSLSTRSTSTPASGSQSYAASA